MKQDLDRAKASLRNEYILVGTAVLCAAVILTIALAGFGRKNASLRTASSVSNGVDTAALSASSNVGSTYESLDVVSWKKASIDEYDVAQVTAKPQVTKESLEDVSLTANASASLRKSPSRSSEALAVIYTGEEVIAFEKTSDGWYGVEYNGKKGYVSEASFDETPEPEEVPEPVTYTGVITYTDVEFDMLCYVIQSEVGNCSEASKLAVSNVVINRVKSPLFPDSITGVLTAPDQFTAINNYYSRSFAPSQNTIDCVRRALNGQDNTAGAVYYYAPKYCSGSAAAWFETQQLTAEIEGQRFFRNW